MHVFQAWTVVTGLFFLFLSWKTRRFTKSLISLKNLPSHLEQKEATPWPKVSFVIPACNEVATIESAMRSLLNIDYPNLEFILVEDRSSDGTDRIVDRFAFSDSRVKVLHITELPTGWLGKVNALDKGISMTSGDWILLADADVHLATDALKKAVAFSLKERLDFLTVIPEIKTKSFGLKIMIAQLFHQASVFFDPRRINDPSHKACYGQGAFMLLKRSTYEQSEKMEWLKMEVVDDTGLALLMRRAGARMGAVAGQGEVQLEWYPDLKSFIRGMEKNAFAFAQYSLPILCGFILSTFLIFLGFTLSPIESGSWIYEAFSASCLLIYLFSIRKQMRNLMQIRIWSILLFPLSFICLPMIFLRAALLTFKQGGVIWRGTFYSLSELRTHQRMKLANLVFAPNLKSSEDLTDEHTVTAKAV